MITKLKVGGVALFLASLGLTVVMAQTPITTAGTTIAAGGDYIVTVDTLHSDADTSDGFKVTADNVYIDGNGKVAFGAGYAQDRQGLYVRAATGAGLNVNVKNLTFEGYRTGAYYRIATGSVENCTFIDCEKGVNANSRRDPLVSGVVIKGCTFETSHKLAIEVRGSAAQVLNNTVTADDTLTGFGYGIAIERGHPIADGGYNTTNCLVSGNTIQGGGWITHGLYLDRSIDNIYENNTIDGCYLSGINLVGGMEGDLDIYASGNTFTNNAVTLPDSVPGVLLEKATDNTFDTLTVSGSDWALIASDGAVGNLISNSSLADSILLTEGSEVTLMNTVFDTSMAVVKDSSLLRWGYHLTVNAEYEAAAVTATVTVEDTNGVDLAKGESGDEIDLVTFFRNADTTVYQGPFVITATYNTAMMDYAAKDTLDIESDSIVTFTTWTQDVSQAHYVIREAGTYTFPASVDLSSQEVPVNAIKMFADNVTIEGGDTTVLVGPTYAYDRQGVWARTTSPDHNEDDPVRRYANVRNMTVSEFRHGIFWRLASGIIYNNTVNDCEKGIVANNRKSPLISGTTIDGNTLHNITKMAIEFRGGPGGKVTNNVITADSVFSKDMRGIGVEKGHPIADGGYNTTGCLISGNKVSNMKTGLWLDLSIGNTFKKDTLINCIGYGISIEGSPSIYATGNTFENIPIEFPDGSEAVGVRYTYASGNEMDSLSVDSAKVAVKAHNGSQNNLITNSKITNSDSLDFALEGNSNLFVVDTDFDQSKVSVEEGSALFIGEGYDVDLSVLLLNYTPVAEAEVTVTNAAGDIVNTYETDENGETFFRVAAEGITSSGHSATQNPFTITAKTVVGVGEETYGGSITVTVTKDDTLEISIEEVLGLTAAMGLPTEFALSQNYPNPFNPLTTIQYGLPVPGNVRLRIYNMLGRTVRTLRNNDPEDAGYHKILWDGRDDNGHKVASGIYIYELVAGDFRQAKKMVFLK